MKLYWALLFSLFVGFDLPPLLGAESLNWDQRVIEKTMAKHAVVKVAFRFENPSDHPVTILSVTPSCDCTTVELNKTTFTTGEHGQIDIVYDAGDSTGPQYKTITVVTDENPNDSVELLLKIKIPELIDITPRVLTWQVGEARIEKSMEISLATDPVIAVTGAKSKDPEMDVRFETVVPNKKYRLFVRPVSTARPRRATFTVTTLNVADNVSETHVVYAQIR